MDIPWFRIKTFTDKWARVPQLNLTVDLGSNSVCGVPLGRPIREFYFLGQTEAPKSFRDIQTIYYFSLGLALGFDKESETFCDFRLIWSDYLKEGFSTYNGTLLLSGVPIIIPDDMSRKRVLAMLGTPYADDKDAEEEILFYERPGVEWQFEFDLTGKLKQLIVTDAPILADKSNRDAYGIDKPWPPA